jgi:hypothetical protein
MKKSELKNMIKDILRETIFESKPIIKEAKAPDNSVHGCVGLVAMPMLEKIMKKFVPKKYVTFKRWQTAGYGLWLIEFDGYTRSDIGVSGWVSLIAPGGAIKHWQVQLEFTDAMKGKVDETYEFSPSVDWTPTFENAAKRLKQWVEM